MAAINGESLHAPQNEKKSNHPYGNPEEIARFVEGNQISVNKEVLNTMLMHKDVKNRKIIAFSIVGAFRKGKSYFLNYCLRILYATYPSINYPKNNVENPKDWLGPQKEPLKGFSFRSGKNRDTTGIVFWNDVFLYTNKRGEKIAIIVMDTQGLFDNDTTPVDNSRIFALSTLISSIQVLNLTSLIQEDQLQYLQFATEFAKYATSKTSGKAFQKLLFLIRDWVNFDDHDCGLDGGLKYLDSVLEVKSNQDEKLKTVRQYIKRSFEELNCCLLPSPGSLVSGSKKMKSPYDGNWGDMEEDFRYELVILIEYLLRPERLVCKKINGKDLTGQEFYHHIIKFLELFQSDELPQAQTIYESTVENNLKVLTDKCIDRYRNIVYSNLEKIENKEQIKILHKRSRQEALLMYAEDQKMGDYTAHKKYENILSAQVEQIFNEEWGNQKEMNMKLIQEQQENARKAKEEQHLRSIETEEIKKRTTEMLIEKTKKEHQDQIEYERLSRIQKLKEEQLIQKSNEAEQEKLAQLEEMKKNCLINDEKFMREKKLSDERKNAKEARIRLENEKEQQRLAIKRSIENEEFMKLKEEQEEKIKLQNSEAERVKAENEKNKAISDEIAAAATRKKYKDGYDDIKKKFVWYSDLSIYDSYISQDIITTGTDSNGNKIYCGRALHNGVYYPAKIVTDGGKKKCTITYDGTEIEKIQFEAPVGTHTWENYGNKVPSKSVHTGRTSDGESMYIGRVYHEGMYLPGKIIDGNYFITFSFEGKEIKQYSCEVLRYEFSS